MNVLLTSCGLETPAIEKLFLDRFPKPPEQMHAMFVPTAANSPDAIEVLPKCLADLLKCGIRRENIFVNDLHTPLREGISSDLVYLCGGSTEYLLDRINEQVFREQLLEFIAKNGLVLGVSAGSVIFSNVLPGNLGLLKCPLDVHCEDYITPGRYPIERSERVRLGNRQAIVLGEKEFIVY